MKKRVIALITAFAVACTSTTAYAHDSDVFGGKYIGKTSADFVVRINPSACNRYLTISNSYRYATDWNGISSNVKLSVINASPGMPSIPNSLAVNGVSIVAERGGVVLGQVLFYDKNYNECDENTDCACSAIEMNISADAQGKYNELGENSKEANALAKKVFLHELGHALKLAHPVKSATHTGENAYNGYPYAIMNEGSLNDEVCASDTITDHDKSCLIAKWGK